MELRKMLKIMRDQTPRRNLIELEEYPDFLSVYSQNKNQNDLYYMGIKYATLETITDDMEEFLDCVDVALVKQAYKWEKLYNVNNLEYDPIANVDATIEETRDIDARHTEDTFGGSDATSENGQAPTDSSTYHNVTKQHTTTEERTDEHNEDAFQDKITTIRKGNIGVTSTQQLIEAEREVANHGNLLDIIMADVINFVTFPYFTEG